VYTVPSHQDVVILGAQARCRRLKLQKQLR
jgi:hypothetical protein